MQQPIAVVERARVGRIDERKILRLAQAIGGQPQQQRGEIRAQYFRFGEGGARLEVGLRVQPHAEPRPEPPAAALALVGAGARNRLDGQALQAIARAVAADARQAGIDDGSNARHGDRGLGHVGRQHDSLPRAALKYPALLLPGQPRIQLEDLDAGCSSRCRMFADIAYLALAGQEHQNIAAADFPGLGGDFLVRLENRGRQVGIVRILAPFRGSALRSDGCGRSP